jgi:hypothetical protein
MIKLAGCYKTKDNFGYLVVNKKYSDNTYKCVLFTQEDDISDVEIIDMGEEEIKALCDLSKCFVPKIDKRTQFLYALIDNETGQTIKPF